MGRIAAILLCVFLSSGTAFSQPAGQSADFALPKGLVLVLPKDGLVKAEWVAPPLAEARVRKSAIAFQIFRLGPKGAVWMGYNRKSLSNLASGMVFSLSGPLQDFIFLDDGALFILSDNALGLIPPLDKERISPADPVLPFQPIVRLPAEKCAVASDGTNAIFVYGYMPQEKAYAVFELLKGVSGWQKVFVSGERISAVCAHAGVVYIACGRQVFRLKLGEKTIKAVFTHPLEFVTGLSYKPGTGLFYATARGIGLVSGAGVEFIKCPSPQIQVREDALYVFLPDSLGVMRLKNIDSLVSDRGKKKE